MNLSKLKWALVVGMGLLLTGCGTLMKNVMATCDNGQTFDIYASCIKSTYTRDGARPNDTTVKTFLTRLDVIVEAYNQKNITEAQARSFTYEQYKQTIDAKDGADSNFYRAMMVLGAMGNMPQGTVQPATNTSTQTRCTRSGNAVNCTSY